MSMTLTATGDIDGYRFDGGPTVITAPRIFDEIWQAAGRRRQDYFRLVACDPFYRIFDHNLQPFDFSADHDVMPRQIARRSPADVEGYSNFIASTRNSYLGSAFSIQPTLTQSAWFRPHNRSEDVDNLYFVGAGTHPGAGVAGVVSSAKIVDNLIGDPAAAGAPAPTVRAASTRTVPCARADSAPAGG